MTTQTDKDIQTIKDALLILDDQRLKIAVLAEESKERYDTPFIYERLSTASDQIKDTLIELVAAQRGIVAAALRSKDQRKD